MTIHASLRSYVFCILWSFILLPFITLPAATKQQPNVLFLAVDDMNDWIGCLDSPLPRIAGLVVLRAVGSGVTGRGQ